MGTPTNSVSGKGRVRSVLTYKKPAFWLLLIGIVASIVLAICFLTNSTRQGLEDAGTLSSWKNGRHLYTWTSDGDYIHFESYRLRYRYDSPGLILLSD